MMKRSGKYRAYLLRLWREGQANSWRATLQNPHTGERLNFATLSSLLTFLEQETGESWVLCDDKEGGRCNG